MPAAAGRYFFGDYCSGTIWSFDGRQRAAVRSAVERARSTSLSSFGEDGNGELYAVGTERHALQAPAAGLARAAAAHLRRLRAERGVGERLQRLVQRRELALSRRNLVVVGRRFSFASSSPIRSSRSSRTSKRRSERSFRSMPYSLDSRARPGNGRRAPRPSAASTSSSVPTDLDAPRGADMGERDVGELARRVGEDADRAPAAWRRRRSAPVSPCGRKWTGPRSSAKRCEQGPPVAEPLVEQRRGGDAVVRHVELDVRAPRRVLEPVVPERPRVREDRVEIEGEGVHAARC